MCGRGMEIRGQEVLDARIRGGMAQLRFATGTYMVEILPTHAREGYAPFAEGYVPLVTANMVKTADLWRLRSGVSLEGVQDASELSQVADEVDLLYCYDAADFGFRQHMREIAWRQRSEE